MSRSEPALYRATHLRTAMRHQGRSVAWMGRQCNRSRSHIWRVMMGQRRASSALASTISGLLGVPVALLFERAEHTETTCD